MTATDAAFTGAIPQIYDRRLGSFLFEPYARDLARRLAGFGGDLLETAAGTGIVTRELSGALEEARIVATDLNPAMLEHAAGRLPDAPVRWRQADALELPFEAAAFDAVVCQFGAMFFPDRIRGYAEARRVLRPGGRFLFSVWDRLEENEAALAVHEAVAAQFPDDPPGFIRRTPHGYFDRDRIRADLRAAGFEDIEIETVPARGRAARAEDPAIGLCQGSPLRNEIEARNGGRLQAVTEAAALAVADRFGLGPIDTRIQAVVIEARV
ncbi:MAG: class I SAM-dependent methyltransferase [Phenylobacterium sp.]